MTMTIDISPEKEKTRQQENAERAEFAEWKGASGRTLQEVWDNDKDAGYDTPLEMNNDTHS